MPGGSSLEYREKLLKGVIAASADLRGAASSNNEATWYLQHGWQATDTSRPVPATFWLQPDVGTPEISTLIRLYFRNACQALHRDESAPCISINDKRQVAEACHYQDLC